MRRPGPEQSPVELHAQPHQCFPVGGQLEQRHHERSDVYNEQWAKTSGCRCDVVLSLPGFYKPFLKNLSHVNHVGLYTRREDRPVENLRHIQHRKTFLWLKVPVCLEHQRQVCILVSVKCEEGRFWFRVCS